MENSPLARLPAELRCHIYAHVLLYDEAVNLWDFRDDLTVWWEPWPRLWINGHNQIGLLSTCRQIYREATPVFLSGNKFVFNAKVLAEYVDDAEVQRVIQKEIPIFVGSLGKYVQYVERFELVMSEWDICSAEKCEEFCCFVLRWMRFLQENLRAMRAVPELTVWLYIDCDLDSVALTIGRDAFEGIEAARKQVEDKQEQVWRDEPEAVDTLEGLIVSMGTLELLRESIKESEFGAACT